MRDESWKHNRFPLPFWCHEDTHVRFYVFVETQGMNLRIHGNNRGSMAQDTL